jgi:hypothetical protein
LEAAAATRAALAYLGLCRAADAAGAFAFRRPISYLARLAFLQRRSLERALPDLERLGLLRVERRRISGTKANDLSLYTLTSYSRHLASRSRNLATGRGLQPVADIPDYTRLNQTRGKSLSVAEQITCRGELTRAREQLSQTRGADGWERSTPQWQERHATLKSQIETLERKLGL